ncbi:antitoxin protein [Cnuibacter physcomitrellae]|uniref:Antitoxin protein n=1 Tax=Cnuibacter physcomitrellae TaxID=1619308 RepID=A0A1X9LJC2_9MICO|nr:Rv0909 family putative TA system antitoxin [Cnuibacter physcomitrellae]ARJ04592.1 antitoxin protein [Cnuibacter physcomitrellae]
MGIDDMTRKAQQFLGDEKVQNALKSEKAEDVSDRILDGVAGAVNRVTGEKHTDKVEKARAEADKRVGNE